MNQRLLNRHGTTYAQQIGIRLQDNPGPLFQLLYSALLMSARISAANPVQAAKALVEAGLTKLVRRKDFPGFVAALIRTDLAKNYDEILQAAA